MIGTMTTTELVLIVVGSVIVVSVAAGFLGRFFVRRGVRTPLAVRLINHATAQVVDLIKEPITVAVLDEVIDVLRTGSYTQNLAAALRENHEQIKDMIAEKIKQDPATRHIGLVPFHDRMIGQVTETSMRVLLEVLADPRMDELVSDVLRTNVDQIRQAVRKGAEDRETAAD
jgi:hypothetical protein